MLDYVNIDEHTFYRKEAGICYLKKNRPHVIFPSWCEKSQQTRKCENRYRLTFSHYEIPPESRRAGEG